ncbi:MAG: cadherin-like beta sandwich domain-containing protein, partial [Bacteroidales bacterium]|nr:cadherin-like beta sandwich domain-containing protein [Bacteroidales bacterium]
MKRLGLLGVVLAACLCGCCGGLRAQDTVRMTVYRFLVLDWRTAGNDATLVADIGNERQTITPRKRYEFDDTVSIALYCPTSLLSLKTNGRGNEGSGLLSLDVSGCLALDSLDCSYGNEYYGGLTSLDLSHNTTLWYLACSGNKLTSLDLSHNTYLRYLACNINNLTSLDLSNNEWLVYLHCRGNKLTSLDVSSCTVLKDLDCYYNQLPSLDLSNNKLLEVLDCTSNELPSLDVSGCSGLRNLYCDRNELTFLDVSKNEKLEHLYCNYCNLTSLEWDKYRYNSEFHWKNVIVDGNRKRGILEANSNRFDLNSLPGFKLERAYNWKGGKVVDGHYLEYDSAVVTYEYKVNDQEDSGVKFCLKTKNNDANLSALEVVRGIDMSYMAFWGSPVPSDVSCVVPFSCKEISVKATPVYEYARILSGTGDYHLAVGDNRIEIEVMSDDSSQRKTYTLEVRRRSNDAALRSLDVNTGTLKPAFAPDIYDYQLELPYETDSLEVFAVARHDSARVYGAGKYGLRVGDNNIRINVRSEDYSGKTYTLAVRRLSADATLRSLMVSAGVLKPAFSSEVYDYDVTVSYETDSLEVFAEARSESATVSGVGKYGLAVGDNRMEIEVVAEDGTQRVYTLSVRRKRGTSSDAALQSLTVSAGTLEPAFSPETRYYHVEVPYETDSLEVGAVARHGGAIMSGAGKYGLQVGYNYIEVVVTAEDDTQLVYTLSVRRQERILSSDATLRVLSVSVGTLRPSFRPTTFNYRVEVPNDVTSMEVLAEPNDDSAKVSYVKRLSLATGD